VDAGGGKFKINHWGFQNENELFWRGISGVEGASLNLWKELAKTSNTIIDIGANTGVYSLVAGAVNPQARIISFEPLPENFARLKANVRINNFNIEPQQIAIGDKNGEVTFYVSGVLDSSLNSNHRSGTKEITVQSKTLDSFISENGIVPDLVKIDVERFEPEVITGFIKGIEAYHPTMIVEILDNNIAGRIEQLLKGSQYLFFGINEETGKLTRMDKLVKPDGFNVLMCTNQVDQKLHL
jgi:FkbM family methyltransferase